MVLSVSVQARLREAQAMMNKTERAEFDAVRYENERLKKQLDRMQTAINREQDRIVDLELLMETCQHGIEREMTAFKKGVVECLTGTPVAEQ